jgi:hypothetical protein
MTKLKYSHTRGKLLHYTHKYTLYDTVNIKFHFLFDFFHFFWGTHIPNYLSILFFYQNTTLKLFNNTLFLIKKNLIIR